VFDPDRLVPVDVRRRLVALREEIHRHPELAFQERETSQRLYEALGQLRPAALERIADTGVVARFRGRDQSRRWLRYEATSTRFPSPKRLDCRLRHSAPA